MEEKERRSKVLTEVHDAGVQGEHAGAHLAVGDGRANRAEIGNIEALQDLRKNSKRKGKSGSKTGAKKDEIVNSPHIFTYCTLF